MNPIVNMFNTQPLPGPLGNMQNMMNQFQQFRSQFQGNPQQQVQNLLNSGRMTPQQFN